MSKLKLGDVSMSAETHNGGEVLVLIIVFTALMAAFYLLSAFGWAYIIETLSPLLGYNFHPNRWIVGLLVFIPYSLRIMFPLWIIALIISL